MRICIVYIYIYIYIHTLHITIKEGRRPAGGDEEGGDLPGHGGELVN